MFHLIHGSLVKHGDHSYIDNGSFGLQVMYEGVQTQGRYFLVPQIDLNNQAIRYYAFDFRSEQDRFESVLKIQGVGGKTAYQLAMLPVEELRAAIQSFDLKYFQAIKGIGPKTAKRILVEMKSTLVESDVSKLKGDTKVIKDIVSSLTNLGYQKSVIQETLEQYVGEISQETLPIVMKRVIDHI